MTEINRSNFKKIIKNERLDNNWNNFPPNIPQIYYLLNVGILIVHLTSL